MEALLQNIVKTPN